MGNCSIQFPKLQQHSCAVPVHMFYMEYNCRNIVGRCRDDTARAPYGLRQLYGPSYQSCLPSRKPQAVHCCHSCHLLSPTTVHLELAQQDDLDWCLLQLYQASDISQDYLSSHSHCSRELASKHSVTRGSCFTSRSFTPGGAAQAFVTHPKTSGVDV